MEQVTEQDLAFLRQAIDLARKARNDGRHPFGSLIVNERGETVVAARNNAVRPKGDPTQHAEMLACGQAARLLTEAEARPVHSVHQHRALRHVCRRDLLDRHWPRGLCPGRNRPAALHRQPYGKSHPRSALPRSLCPWAKADRRRWTFAGGGSGQGPRGFLGFLRGPPFTLTR